MRNQEEQSRKEAKHMAEEAERLAKEQARKRAYLAREEAIEKVKEHKPDLVLMDIMLEGEMDGIKAAKPVYISPYVLTGIEKNQVLNEAGTQYDQETNSQLTGGLDIKYSLNSNLTLDLTANTAFAQVEADDEYVNIIKQKEDALYDIYGQEVFKRIIDPNFGNKTIRIAERIDDKAHTTPKEELKKRGLKFQDGIDSLESGHLKVREMLHYEMKYNEIVVQPKFFIADNCPNTIKHLSRYSRKDIMTSDGDVKDKVGVQEKYKDFCDLVRYFWMSDPRYISEYKTFEPENRRVY